MTPGENRPDIPGPIALFGSGETSASGRRVYERLFRRLAAPPRVAVLETPAGFQPNSPLVAEKVAEFLRGHLQGYSPEVTVVPARRRGTPFSTDDPRILAPLLEAGAIFLGPGSPTYAVRQLRGSLAWRYLLARHLRGASLVLASAATIAASARALPVYEIYKAGADLHWADGLDLFRLYGLSLILVPHWNNREGGADLDTSRCFMGEERFRELLTRLDLADRTVVGIDEHTALMVEPGEGFCRVMGLGGVTLLRRGDETRIPSGRSFPVSELGPFRRVEVARELEAMAVGSAPAPRLEEPAAATPPPSVVEMVEKRESARARRDWAVADALRGQIEEMGWEVQDTREGPVVRRLPGAKE